MAKSSLIGAWSVAAAVVLGMASVSAQERQAVMATPGWELRNVESLENVPAITGAPFTADATTEFIQTLPDGNRIEQRYATSVARDGRGRTRREQQLALVGPLTAVLQGDGRLYASNTAGRGGRGAWQTGNAQGEPPRFVIISDPVEGVSYTLDEAHKEARRSPALALQKLENGPRLDDLKKLEATLQKVAEAERAGIERPVVEQLGTRQIEGVAATGVRTTTTIPAGQIGNLNPIHLVTERWFSEQLGMAVQITRSDPRSGETVYRLKNIVRAEPPPDLFSVPSDYKVIDSGYAKKLQDIQKLGGAGGRGKVDPTR
jgi:hypothetical protein